MIPALVTLLKTFCPRVVVGNYVTQKTSDMEFPAIEITIDGEPNRDISTSGASGTVESTVKIVFVSDAYSTAFALREQVRVALNGQMATTINGYRFDLIHLTDGQHTTSNPDPGTATQIHRFRDLYSVHWHENY